MKTGLGRINGRNYGGGLRQWTLRRVCSAVAVGLVGLSVSASAQIVSNLGEEPIQVIPAVRGTALASNAFTTGSNLGGYTLDSATINIRGVNGSPGDLVVGIHASSGLNPGAQLEDLAGADPQAAGNHTFTSSGINLNANTTYHIQLSSPTSSGESAYSWFATESDSQTSTDGWTIADAGRDFAEESWGNLTEGKSYHFSIQATPVPEPHEYAMFVGLGLIGFVAARRRLHSEALA